MHMILEARKKANVHGKMDVFSIAFEIAFLLYDYMPTQLQKRSRLAELWCPNFLVLPITMISKANDTNLEVIADISFAIQIQNTRI